jgi:hypothetical protein
MSRRSSGQPGVDDFSSAHVHSDLRSQTVDDSSSADSHTDLRSDLHTHRPTAEVTSTSVPVTSPVTTHSPVTLPVTTQSPVTSPRTFSTIPVTPNRPVTSPVVSNHPVRPPVVHKNSVTPPLSHLPTHTGPLHPVTSASIFQNVGLRQHTPNASGHPGGTPTGPPRQPLRLADRQQRGPSGRTVVARPIYRGAHTPQGATGGTYRTVGIDPTANRLKTAYYFNLDLL